MVAARAVPTLQVDNDRVRATRWDFAPCAKTGFHRHEYDCVIVPVLDGALGLSGPQGSTRAALVAGVRYFRQAGVERDVENVNPNPFAFVEVEPKQPG